ncbi:MAG: hypothetical protein K0S28_930 [Paucimonas sp.]|jgi:hypothetical protein|nr:hypothetical protein [Paucimonas sp.]
MTSFELSRDSFGKLVFSSPDLTRPVAGVVPVRAFPIGAPDEGIAIVDADGHELAWIDDLSVVADNSRKLIEEELANREFLPEIRRLVHVSGFATPSTWDIETDRGPFKLVLRGEEAIRRIAHSSLLIADTNGVQFLVRDLQSLDRASRRLLDRFL